MLAFCLCALCSFLLPSFSLVSSAVFLPVSNLPHHPVGFPEFLVLLSPILRVGFRAGSLTGQHVVEWVGGVVQHRPSLGQHPRLRHHLKGVRLHPHYITDLYGLDFEGTFLF